MGPVDAAIAELRKAYVVQREACAAEKAADEAHAAAIKQLHEAESIARDCERALRVAIQAEVGL